MCEVRVRYSIEALLHGAMMTSRRSFIACVVYVRLIETLFFIGEWDAEDRTFRSRRELSDRYFQTAPIEKKRRNNREVKDVRRSGRSRLLLPDMSAQFCAGR